MISFSLCLLSNLRGEGVNLFPTLFSSTSSVFRRAGKCQRASVPPPFLPPPGLSSSVSRVWILGAVYTHRVVLGEGDSPFTLLSDCSLGLLKGFRNISGFPTEQRRNIYCKFGKCLRGPAREGIIQVWRQAGLHKFKSWPPVHEVWPWAGYLSEPLLPHPQTRGYGDVVTEASGVERGAGRASQWCWGSSVAVDATVCVSGYPASVSRHGKSEPRSRSPLQPLQFVHGETEGWRHEGFAGITGRLDQVAYTCAGTSFLSSSLVSLEDGF